MSGPPLEEILDALDLSRGEPGRGLLEALFSRFLARVPFETVSKILRHAEIADPLEKPRRPDLFWADFLEWGAGGTCYARVAAFRHLLAEMGYTCRIALGKIEKDFDHAALLVTGPAGAEWIADVGFPLPAILPSAAGELDTGLGMVRISRPAGSILVELLEGVPSSARRIEIFDRAVSDEEFLEHWRATFREGSRFLSRVGLRTQTEARAFSYAEGELRVDDRHSRLAIPIAPPRAARLGELFSVGAEEIGRAFSIVGEGPVSAATPSFTAWMEVEATPERAWEAIASPQGYAELLDGVGETSRIEETAGGWRLRLSPPGAAGESGLSDDVTRRPDSRELSVVRSAGAAGLASFWRVEVHGGRTHLTREARPSSPPEELLRNDALRGRFAATLAVDLLAWARRL